MDLGEFSNEDCRLDQIAESDIVCAEGAWKFMSKAGAQDAHRAGWCAVHGCIDQYHCGVVLKIGEQVEPAGSPVHHGDMRWDLLLCERLSDVDSNAFIAEEEVADAEYEYGWGG